MPRSLFAAIVCCLPLLAISAPTCGNENPVLATDRKPAEGTAASSCFAPSEFREAWIKVGERLCLKCHNAEGAAADSAFLLRDTSRAPVAERADAILQNCGALTEMATTREEDGRARLLVKATGGLDHGGGEVVKADSTELRTL